MSILKPMNTGYVYIGLKAKSQNRKSAKEIAIAKEANMKCSFRKDSQWSFF